MSETNEVPDVKSGGNPHPRNVVAHLGNAFSAPNPAAASAHASYAQAEATMALVYEQRTANLIAITRLAVDVDTAGVYEKFDTKTINERLNLA